MSLSRINKFLRERLPRVHAALKRATYPWMRTNSFPVPVPKRLGGRLTLVHPRFLTEDLEEYEPHVREWIGDVLHRGGIFFDIGAHVGWHGIYGARCVGRGGHVFAFEPSPRMLSY